VRSPWRVAFGCVRNSRRSEPLDAYFNLLDELRGLPGVDVDLVMVDAVKNRYIAADIARTRQSLYAA